MSPPVHGSIRSYDVLSPTSNPLLFFLTPQKHGAMLVPTASHAFSSPVELLPLGAESIPFLLDLQVDLWRGCHRQFTGPALSSATSTPRSSPSLPFLPHGKISSFCPGVTVARFLRSEGQRTGNFQPGFLSRLAEFHRVTGSGSVVSATRIPMIAARLRSFARIRFASPSLIKCSTCAVSWTFL